MQRALQAEKERDRRRAAAAASKSGIKDERTKQIEAAGGGEVNGGCIHWVNYLLDIDGDNDTPIDQVHTTSQHWLIRARGRKRSGLAAAATSSQLLK